MSLSVNSEKALIAEGKIQSGKIFVRFPSIQATEDDEDEEQDSDY